MIRTIPLYPETLLCYYMQLTALGLGGYTKPVSGKLVIDDKDYVRIVENAMNKIITAKLGKQVPYNQICNELNSPRIYTAGKGDQKILQGCGLLDQKSDQKRDQERAWCMAAVNYVEQVKKEGGSVEGSGKRSLECEPLMLCRATVYGTTRGAIPMEIIEDPRAKLTVDSIGLALIGGLASLLDGGRKGKKYKDKDYEYFLIPDGSAESLENIASVLEVFHGATGNIGSFTQKVEKLMELGTGGLSIDSAAFFSAIYQAAKAVNIVARLKALVDTRAFERYILVRNECQTRRPQIMWMSPLAISQAVDIVTAKKADRFLESLLDILESLESIAKIGDISQVEGTVAECINSSLLYLWTGRQDLLVKCSRSLSILADKEGMPPSVVRKILKALYSAKHWGV